MGCDSLDFEEQLLDSIRLCVEVWKMYVVVVVVVSVSVCVCVREDGVGLMTRWILKSNNYF